MNKIWWFLSGLVVVVFIFTVLVHFDIAKISEERLEIVEGGHTEIIEDSFKKTPKVPRERNLSYQERMRKANLLDQDEYYTLAIKEYQTASSLAPQKSDPYLKIGIIHFRNNNFEAAKNNFEKAYELNKTHLETQLYLARTLLKMNEINGARDIIDGLSNTNQTVALYQGMLATFFGEDDRAKQLYQQAVHIGTTQDVSDKAQSFLNAYSEFELTEGGQQNYLKTLLARGFNQAGEYTLAIPFLHDALKEQSNYRDAWILLGYAYLKLENYFEAKDAFLEAYNIDPEKAETLYFLGLTYFGLDQLDLAIENLEIAYKNGFEPKIQLKQKLAEIYLLNNDYPDAAKTYEEILDLNNGDVNFYVRPVWIYLEHLQKPKAAVALGNDAVTAHPTQAMSYNLRGWANISAGELEQARKDLEKALSLDSEMGAVYLNLGQLYEAEEKLALAKQNYRKAYELSTQGSAIANLAAERYNSLIASKKDS